MCKKEDVEMAAEALVKDANFKEQNIPKALKQFEMIQSGKLPKKTARDFLKESRKR